MLCPVCKEELEVTFQAVKKYVEDNRGASVQQVVEDCGVEIQQIREWIREERLEFSEGSSIGVACEKCGASIRTGRFCEKCKAEDKRTTECAGCKQTKAITASDERQQK